MESAPPFFNAGAKQIYGSGPPGRKQHAEFLLRTTGLRSSGCPTA